MKQFFEQYGGVALGILALLVLIAMITPVGNIIKTSLQGTVQTFSTKMDGQVNTMTESMTEAFENASQLSGIVDGKLYVNGGIFDSLREYTFIENGTKAIHDSTGKILIVRFDVNGQVGNSVYSNYLETYGIKFDLYYDGERISQGAQDHCVNRSINNIEKYKLIITAKNENVTIDQEEYDVYFSSPYLKVTTDNSHLDIQFNIKIYPN